MPRVWIAQILVDPSVEWKLRNRRGLTGDDVRRACLPDAYVSAVWEEHDSHGRRLLVRCTTETGLALKLVLQPVDPARGIWRLRTALRMMKR